MDTQSSDGNKDSSDNDLDIKNDILNYKGYFVENGINDEDEQKLFEFGAHFPYRLLYQRLEVIAKQRKERQLEIEKKLYEKEKNEQIESNKITTTYKPKIKSLKSRNKDDSNNILTYEPQLKQNALNNENQATKKTANKTQSKNNYNTNNDELNKKINNKNKNKLFSQYQMRIRKRNNFLNYNNSGHINTVSINLYNKINLNDNSKNLTHNIPFISKMQYITPNKIKSIRCSRQKLYYQILKSGLLNKKTKINNNILNKLLITKNKGSFSKCLTKTNQNTLNISFSKNINSNIKNSKNNILDIKMKQSIKKANLDIKIKNKNAYLIRTKNNVLSKKKKLLNNRYRIPNNNYCYKALMINKKPNLKFIDNIGNSKVNISRNNMMSLFNNKTILNTDKNTHCLNNVNNSNNNNNYIQKYITNSTITHYKNKNIIPKFKQPQINVHNKNQIGVYNKKEIINNTTKNNLAKNNKNIKLKNNNVKINKSNVHEKLKEFLNKNNSNKYLIKHKKDASNNNNINQNNKKIAKKSTPKARKGCEENNEKLNLLKGNKKNNNNININININNQNNIILNDKLFAENSNLISIGSINLAKNKVNDDIKCGNK